ncbi:MAG: magnesium/cobalt transporter CorA [Spirochaetota bacterium]
MAKPNIFVSKKNKKIGQPPGSLVHTGTRYLDDPTVELIAYNKSSYHRSNLELSLNDLQLDEHQVGWLNISGIHDSHLLETVGKRFSIHRLLLEDIMNAYQRPKIEFSDQHILVILKMVTLTQEGVPAYEQVSLLLGNGYLISFQERPGDVLEGIRERIARNAGQVRLMGADYLCYAVIDALVDQYFVVLEHLSDRIEDIEEEIRSAYDESLSGSIHSLRKEVIYLRKSVQPLRDMFSALLRDGADNLDKSTFPYYRDVQDHITQIIDQLDTFRDLVSGLSDSYISSVSNRMNSVMKILTLISTIFIPLTFIAGIYGMNFAYMPELELRWGYAAVLGVMAVVFVGMVIFFKRKKWF